MRAGSLFAGYGGLDLAAHDALGTTTAWVAETDPAATAVLAHRFPDAPNHGDVTTIDWGAVEPAPLLTAGYPCQGESDAGNRLGDKDPRWLWPVYREAIAAIRPRIAVGENVRAHIGRSFRHVVADLQAMGYAVVWVVVSAADVGACHLRERVFWAAYPQEFGPPASLGQHPFAHLDGGVMVTDDLFGGAPCVSWPTAGAAYAGVAYAGASQSSGLLKTPTAQLAINGGSQHPDKRAAGGHGPTLADQVEHALPLLGTPRCGDGIENPLRPWGGDPRGRLQDQIATLLPTPDAGNGRKQTRTGPLLHGIADLLPTPRATDGCKGGPNQRGSSGDLTLPFAVQPERWGPFAAAVARWEAATRPAPDPTIPGRDGRARLNPAFAEWMMGAPEGWITDVPSITRTQALKLAGNGVVRQQGAAAITWLAARLPVGVIPAPDGTRVPA